MLSPGSFVNAQSLLLASPWPPRSPQSVPAASSHCDFVSSSSTFHGFSHSLYEADLEAVAVVQWPWCLPHKTEDLGSNPRHHLKIGVWCLVMHP